MDRKAYFVAFVAVAAIVIVVFVGGWRGDQASAQKENAAQWEYAILGSPYFPFTAENTDSIIVATVNICYVQAAGCRNEQERGEVIVSRFLQETRLEGSADTRKLMQNRAAENAYSRAFARLGLEGFELVSASALKFDRYVATSRGGNTVLPGEYESNGDFIFKRPKR